MFEILVSSRTMHWKQQKVDPSLPLPCLSQLLVSPQALNPFIFPQGQFLSLGLLETRAFALQWSWSPEGFKVLYLGGGVKESCFE